MFVLLGVRSNNRYRARSVADSSGCPHRFTPARPQRCTKSAAENAVGLRRVRMRCARHRQSQRPQQPGRELPPATSNALDRLTSPLKAGQRLTYQRA